MYIDIVYNSFMLWNVTEKNSGSLLCEREILALAAVGPFIWKSRASQYPIINCVRQKKIVPWIYERRGCLYPSKSLEWDVISWW